MNQQKIDRINALYRKSKAEGLSEAERTEQALLRKEFAANVRNNLKAQLDQIDMVDSDGTIFHLGEKYGRKTEN